MCPVRTYEIWPAQHDSNVRPRPLEEIVAAGKSICFNSLQQKNGAV